MAQGRAQGGGLAPRSLSVHGRRMETPPLHGHGLARGTMRLMRAMGHAALAEFVPRRGLRVDVMAVTDKGEVWIVECKSCRADFLTDRKWRSYLEFCDRYFWAVDACFPQGLLPEDAGLILANAHDAEILRLPQAQKLPAARRARLLRDFARAAAWRLQDRLDPGRVL